MKISALFLQASLSCAVCSGAADSPAVFPAPRQIDIRESTLDLRETVPVLLPSQASPDDLFLAQFLTAELCDRYGIALRTKPVHNLPDTGPYILIGSSANPLIRQFVRTHGPAITQKEGYLLDADRERIVVAGSDAAGAFYGLQSLRQLIGRKHEGVQVQGALIRDWPFKPFRGIKLYLPGHENIAYFKRFVRDVMALYKYNTMIVEVNAAMRLERHPELNAGWLELGKDLRYTRRDRSWGPGRQYQDSANADTADGGVLEKDEVRELVDFARKHHIDVIPEIPSLTHSYYLLTRHRELAEIQDAEWPDTYCPSEPKVYPLLFDVLDEYIEAMKPAMVHIGHDEWRMPLGVCPRCKGKDPTELYAADLNRIYAHLREKGIATAIWGDHLIERLRGKKVMAVTNPHGTPYEMPGGLSSDQVLKLIPKDILIFNWFWNSRSDEDLKEGLGEKNEVDLSNWGFHQVFGNFTPGIKDFDRRAARRGIDGGAPSSWAATNELNFGKDLMFDFLGCANLLWSLDRPDMNRLTMIVQSRLPGIRSYLGATPLPSMEANAVVSHAELRAGMPVALGEDVSSLIFRHACLKQGRNGAAYAQPYNFADTAELLGWYEVEYEDRFVETIPVRYAVNILEEGWPTQQAPKDVAYEAAIATRDDGKADFDFEWVNSRFGKAIREIRLKSVSENNPVVLRGLDVVKRRVAPEPKPLRLALEVRKN